MLKEMSVVSLGKQVGSILKVGHARLVVPYCELTPPLGFQGIGKSEKKR